MHERIRDPDLLYCFVDFQPPWPQVYVLPSSLVAEHVTQTHRHWLLTPRRDGGQHSDTTGRRINNRAQFDGRPEGWMDEFLDAWDQIRIQT